MRRWRLAMAIVLITMSQSVFTAGPIVIHVDDDAAPGGVGSEGFPFRNLPEAVAAAYDVAGDVVIKVEPGDYALDATLVIDRALDLRGWTGAGCRGRWLADGDAVPGTLNARVREQCAANDASRARRPHR